MNRFLLFIAWIGAQPNIHLIFLFDVLFTQCNSNWNDLSFFFCYIIIWPQNRVICFVRRRGNIRLIKEILEQWTLSAAGHEYMNEQRMRWEYLLLRVDLYPTNIHLQFLEVQRGKNSWKRETKLMFLTVCWSFQRWKPNFNEE